MIFDNYQEEKYNSTTKEMHELTQQSHSDKSCYDKTIALYNTIPEKERTGEQTRCVVAALILTQRNDEARLLLDKWQDAGKDDVQWNTQYGWTYYLEKKYKEAIPYFDRVEDLTPRDIHMLRYLQQCNENIGNKEESKRLNCWIREINTLKNVDNNKYSKVNYYEKFIQDETARVAKLEGWIETGKVAEDRIPAIKSKIFMVGLHTVIAKYSYGENPKDLVNEFLVVITRFEQGFEKNYIHLENYILVLWMLSLGVLLNISDDNFNRIVAVLDKSSLQKDFLFDYLIRYRMSNRTIAEKLTYEVYQPLIEICNETDRLAAIEKLKVFLDKKWYKGMKPVYWYDNHKSKAETFFGYWSFESGAVVKILGLDDSGLKDSPYYPYDMVHWRD
jgi:tetratricopeptide (TPR) repeat protein